MTSPNSLQQLEDLVRQARRCGADEADAILIDATSQSVNWRQGKLESVDHAEGGDLGLRVLIGKKQAMVSSSDRRKETLDGLVERAVAMAREAPEDPFSGLATPDQIAKTWPHLDMDDHVHVTTEQLIEQVRVAEESALAVPGVTISESTSAASAASTISLVASNGFAGSYNRTGYNLMVCVLAGTGTEMQRDYDYATTIFYEDLPAPRTLGQNAGSRAVKKCGARKMPTQQVPIVFEPRTANTLLHHLAGAINGASIARETSFLLGKLNEQIFSKEITVIDDPFHVRGLRSKAFDGEGLLPQHRKIVDEGRLTTWLLDLRSARQLGLQSTGHASRGTGAPSPSVSNFYIEAGKAAPQDLISDIKNGLYVTDIMGMGVNGITGDYSRAASGYWIQDGAITFPVNEVTIAGNLKDMFLNLHAANDLQFKFGIDAPTLRIEGMTVAGL